MATQEDEGLAPPWSSGRAKGWRDRPLTARRYSWVDRCRLAPRALPLYPYRWVRQQAGTASSRRSLSSYTYPRTAQYAEKVGRWNPTTSW